MKRNWMRITLACLFVACVYCVVQTKAQNIQTQTQTETQTQTASPKPVEKASKKILRGDSEGELRFAAHCGRCHAPPEDISPREARAVVRQMRVRAMLSAEDERLILNYIAP